MNAEKPSIPQDGLPLPQRYWAVMAVATGLILAVLDGAIANVALPTIAKDLNTSPAHSIWVVNAYQVATMISLLAFSSIGEIWGYKKVYLTGLTLFTCTSLLCALSDSMLTLTAARTLQGFGAAAIASVNAALIRFIYPKRYLPNGLSINALLVSVSAAAGPTIASAILAVANWPWIFAVNIPIGVLAITLSYKFLPNNTERTPRKFDTLSAIMNALTFGLIISVIEGFTHGASIYVIIALFISLMVCAYLFFNRENKIKTPLFPVDLLRIPVFSLSVLTSLISFMAQMLAMVSLPFFLQGTLGRNEVLTGLLLTPWPVATMIAAPLAGVLAGRINAGKLGAVGLFIFSAGLFALGSLSGQPTNIDIIWRMGICGFGFGLFQTPNNTTMLSSAPTSRSGSAGGMISTTRLVGQTIGAALVALMFKTFPENNTHICLYFACGIAFLGAIVSMLRIGKPTAAELTRKPQK